MPNEKRIFELIMDHVKNNKTFNEMLDKFKLPGNEAFCVRHVQPGN